MQPLRTDRRPFDQKVKQENATTWLVPKLVGEVKFTEWTSEGEMRHPVFLGLRRQKRPTTSSANKHGKFSMEVRSDHFEAAKSHFFDTSSWGPFCDVTLTLKQALQSDSGAWMKITDHLCRQAHRHFMNLLNRAVYGAAFRRYGKRLRVLPVLEKGEVRKTPVRAIALSISSVPVAAPAPGNDPPPPDDGLLARVRENAESAVNAGLPTSGRAQLALDTTLMTRSGSGSGTRRWATSARRRSKREP